MIKPGTVCYLRGMNVCPGCMKLNGHVVTVTGAHPLGYNAFTPSFICDDHFGRSARIDRSPDCYLLPISDPDFRETDERDRRVSA